MSFSRQMVKWWCIYIMKYNSALKRNDYWYMQHPGKISRELCQVKKVYHTMLYSTWFHVHNVIEMKNYGNGEQIGVLGRLEMRGKYLCSKRTTKVALVGVKTSCINVNILVMIVYCSFARCFHWKKLGKRYKGFPK